MHDIFDGKSTLLKVKIEPFDLNTINAAKNNNICFRA